MSASQFALNEEKLVPVTEWAKNYSYPPLGTLRYLIFHAKTNGFDKCIRRIGRRVLISPEAYFQWVEEQNS